MAGNLGHLAATVSLNIDPFKASARTLSSTIKATTAELRAQDTAFKGSEKSISGMKTVYSTLSSQSKNYSAQLERQKAEYDKLTAAVKSGNGDTEKLTTRQANAAAAYNKTAAQMAAVQNRMAALNKQILLQESGWTKAATGATHFANVTGKIGSGLTSLGSKATMGITVPIVAAFTAASKKAIEFDNTMLETKNLMESGGETAKEAISGVSTMTSDAVKYSNHYGVSVQNIAAGYQDLVKRGYTSKQAIGAMKSELQASLASGDDFNDVVTVASQTLEAFGMKAQTTAAMTANTKTVVNDLAYAADLTSSSFSDLGIGMSYVGSTAHQAGFSLSETSAALGILSNNGLEGQKAGTGLRKVLISLNSAVGAISSKNSVLAKLGIQKADMVDANGNLKSMSDIMEVLAKHTQSMNGVQKAAVFNSLFGTTGQQAGIILANNAKQLAALNDQVAKSGKNDYVGKLSEKNLQSAANQLKIFKESVTNLGMALAENLLPQITPLLNKASQMAQAFGKLDKSTQQQIVRWGLFAAAIGPVSTVLGGVFKVASGGGKIFAGLFSTLARGSVAAKTGATGLDLLRQTFSKTAFEAASGSAAIGESAGQLSLFESATEGAAAGGTSWLAALAPVAPAILGVTAAAAAGYAVWKIWGEKAAESAERTSKWGTDIGAAADKAATKMKSASGEISGALGNTSQTTKQNAKQIVDGFNSITSAAKKASTESDSAAKKLAKALGGDASQELLKETAKEQAANNKRIAQMQANTKKAEIITKAANKTGVALTTDQETVLENLRQSSAAQAVKTLSISGKQQNTVIKAILGEKTTMTKAQGLSEYQDMSIAANKEMNLNKAKQKKINDDDSLTATQRNAALEGLEKDHQAKMSSIITGAIQGMKANGQSQTDMLRNLESTAYGLTQSEAEKAIANYNKNMSKATDATKGFAASVRDDMSASVKKAGNDWNSLVLDPKTGKVKTNLADVLKDTANTKKGWSELTFDLKNAKISSNAKQVIVEALAASKQWQSMPTWEKNAIIRTQGRTELAQIMDDFVNWDQFSLKQQQAIVKGDYTPLINALIKADQWNNLTLKEKQALVKNKATEPIMDALAKSGEWNNLSLKQQQAVISAKGLPDLTDIIIKFGLWNKLTPKQKTLLIQDADARKKLIDAGLLVDKYNLNKPKTKVAKADTANASNNFGLATKAVNKYKNTNPGDTKKAKATDNASTNLGKATKSTKTFANTTVGPTKLAKASNLASGGLDAATRSTKAFKGSSTGSTKVAKAKDNASKTLSIATQSWKNFGGNETVNKVINFTANFAKGVKKLLGFAGGTQDFQGGFAVVNDAPGSLYREAITLPTGQTVSVAGRNVMLPLPRHTKIETAMQSARKYSIPRFASGTSDFTGAVSKINQVSVQTVTPTVSTDSDSSLTDAVGTLNSLVAAMLNSKQQFTGEVTLDNKRVVGRWIADTVRTEIQRLDKIKNRNEGVV